MGYKSGKIKAICDNCGAGIEQYPCQFNKAKHHFCSGKCSKQYYSKIRSAVIICETCGKKKTVPQYFANGNGSGRKLRFCSHQCASINKEREAHKEGSIRKCYNCGDKKPLNDDNWGSFISKHGTKKFRHECRACNRKRANDFRVNNNELARQRLKNWRSKNKEHTNEYKRRYAKERPEYNKKIYLRSKEKPGYKERKKISDDKYYRISRDELRDCIVKMALKRVGVAKITPELIELKRQAIAASRTLKQLRKWRKENEPNNVNVYGKQCEDEKNYEGAIQPTGSFGSPKGV